MRASTNPVVAKQIFEKKMIQARLMEEELHNRRFTFEDNQLKIVFDGRPSMLELEVKEDCSTSHMFSSINLLLKQVQEFRDKAAKELINR